ncbi:hypothetical protein [Rosistilla oblonga]|uniref:hypothetical protein n=1 Tax=Rosistilla oblonga TaxID=2527990 RepID=UPI003A981BFF
MSCDVRNRNVSSLLAGLLAVAAIHCSGCRVLAPVPIPVESQQMAPELVDSKSPQVEIGRPQPIIDGIGWVVGIPDKILLWDRRIDRHKISEETIDSTVDYLQANNLPHIKVRANQYNPLDDWHRLTQNKTVAWPWRYSLGALSVAGETIFPGRIIGGDHFNPFTQTIHLYSDVPAVALHEAAHAKDFTRRTYQGTYAAAYLFVPLWHETLASQDVFAFLEEREDRAGLVEANRILYPAYGTYVGSTVGNFFPAYSAPLYYTGVIAGHINGRMLNRELEQQMPAGLVAANEPVPSQPSETESY